MDVPYRRSSRKHSSHYNTVVIECGPGKTLGFTLQGSKPPFIGKVFKGSLAERQGLRPFQSLIQVNEVNVSDISAERVVELITAPLTHRKITLLLAAEERDEDFHINYQSSTRSTDEENRHYSRGSSSVDNTSEKLSVLSSGSERVLWKSERQCFLIGYLGFVNLDASRVYNPDSQNFLNDNLQSLIQKKPTNLLLEIRDCVQLLNYRGVPVFSFSLASSICLYENDFRYFIIVTRHDLDILYHVFFVDPLLAKHSEHEQCANKFELRCTRLPGGRCAQFAANASYLVKVLSSILVNAIPESCGSNSDSGVAMATNACNPVSSSSSTNNFQQRSTRSAVNLTSLNSQLNPKANTYSSDSLKSHDSEAAKVTSWATSLEQLLSDPCGVQLFERYLTKEFSEENILFWKACCEYSKLSNPVEMTLKAEEIVQLFISRNAVNVVNISDYVRSRIHSNMKKSPYSNLLFQEAQSDIFKLMKHDPYPRFIKSDLYKEYVCGKLTSNNDQKENTNPSSQQQSLPVKLCDPEVKPSKKSIFPWKKNKYKLGSRNASEKDSETDSSSVTSRSSQMPSIDPPGHSKTCRFLLPSGESRTLDVTAWNTIRDALEAICKEENLDKDLVHLCYNDEHSQKVNLDNCLTSLGGCDMAIERRIRFTLCLPNEESMIVRTKPNVAIENCIRPILAAKGFHAPNLVIRLSDSMQPLNLKLAVPYLNNKTVISETIEQYEIACNAKQKNYAQHYSNSTVRSEHDSTNELFKEIEVAQGNRMNDQRGLVSISKITAPSFLSSSTMSETAYELPVPCLNSTSSKPKTTLSSFKPPLARSGYYQTKSNHSEKHKMKRTITPIPANGPTRFINSLCFDSDVSLVSHDATHSNPSSISRGYAADESSNNHNDSSNYSDSDRSELWTQPEYEQHASTSCLADSSTTTTKHYPSAASSNSGNFPFGCTIYQV